MTRFDLHLDSFTFPIKGKVRYQGKVLQKYDLAYYIDVFYPRLHCTVIYDAFTYKELSHRLKDIIELTK